MLVQLTCQRHPVEPGGGPAAHPSCSIARSARRSATALWMLPRQWQLGELHGRRRRGAGAGPDADGSHAADASAKLGEDPRRADDRSAASRGTGGAAATPRSFAAAEDRFRPAAGARPPLAQVDRWASATTRRPFATPIRSPCRTPRCRAMPTSARTPAAFAMMSALAGRAMDGGDLYLHLKEPGARASDGVGGRPPATPAVDAAGEQVRRLVRAADQPAAAGPRRRVDAGPAGVPVRLLRAGGRAGRPRSTRAKEYYLGTAGLVGARRRPPAGPRHETAAATPEDAERHRLRDAHRHPGAAAVRRDAEPALVGFEDGQVNFGGVSDRNHRPRQAAVPRVRAGLQQRLVHCAVHGAGRTVATLTGSPSPTPSASASGSRRPRRAGTTTRAGSPCSPPASWRRAACRPTRACCSCRPRRQCRTARRSRR